MTQELTPTQEVELIQAEKLSTQTYGLLKKIGQAQALQSVEQLTRVANLQAIAEIKESGEYKNLNYQDENGDVIPIKNWGEFCKHHLGTSRSTIDERLQNLKHFGDEFFDHAMTIGLTFKDFRTMRQIPHEELGDVIDAKVIEEKSKDEVLELIEQLAEKNAAEKQALKEEKDKLKKQLDDTESSLQAQRDITKEQGDKLNKSRSKVDELEAKLKRKLKPDEKNKLNEEFINEVTGRLHQETNNTIAMITKVREDYEQDTPDTIEQLLSDQLSRVYETFSNISLTFGIQIRRLEEEMSPQEFMAIFEEDDAQSDTSEEQPEQSNTSKEQTDWVNEG